MLSITAFTEEDVAPDVHRQRELLGCARSMLYACTQSIQVEDVVVAAHLFSDFALKPSFVVKLVFKAFVPITYSHVEEKPRDANREKKALVFGRS